MLFCLSAAAFRVHLTAGDPIVFVGCGLIAAGIIRLILFLRANPVIPGTADPV